MPHPIECFLISKCLKHAWILLALSLTSCGGGGSSSQDSSSIPLEASGLTSRPSNTTCLAPSKSNTSTEIQLEPAYPDLAFNQPLAMLQEPGDSSRWYIIEKTGHIFYFDAANENTTVKSTYFDIRSQVDSRSEGGLLGMAFHPDFATNGYVYLSYTAAATGDPNNEMVSRISRFTKQTGSDALDQTSETIILTQDQFATNHNGGHIAFGPDGYLYIGLGDGGGGGDPNEHGQNNNTLLGAMLRIDVDSSTPYSIPTDNPFASGGGAPEIYAYGLRNPWRWSFDRSTGELWLGDVGQGSFEEINRINLGGNYGWDCYEASSVFESTGCPVASQLEFPVTEYGRSEGVSVTGGFVYRGSAIPALQGVYIFGDFGSGTIWGLFPDSSNDYERRILIDSGLSITSFAEGNDGELYVLDIGGGIYRIIPDSTASSSSGPASKLSETGCVDPSNPVLPAPGLIPYTVNDPFWSDGADKIRYLAIPDASAITVINDADFELPVNSVLMKHFSLSGQIFETRFLVRHDDGSWSGYTYEWNDALTDADLVESTGKDKLINGQLWRYPSQSECMQCHTEAANFSLGLEALQLNGEFTYPETGLTRNQLDTLEYIGMFNASLDNSTREQALINLTDNTADLNILARSYLHSNCANCHQPGGTTQSTMDLRFTTDFADMAICNEDPQQGNLGIPQAKILAPADPSGSILLQRISQNDQHRMPPIGSNLLDTDAMMLLENWISSIQNCP